MNETPSHATTSSSTGTTPPEDAAPHGAAPTTGGDGASAPTRRTDWMGVALFLVIILGLVWIFYPAPRQWMQTDDERWRHGIQAAREMWQLARVYGEIHDGTLPGLEPGTIGENAEVLGWEMEYFVERLRYFDPEDFRFVEVDPVEGTFVIRLAGSHPDSPPGVYTIDQDANETLDEEAAAEKN